MSDAQKKANNRYYAKRKSEGWFKFSKWVHKDKIEPISADEIQAFCHNKTNREGLKK